MPAHRFPGRLVAVRRTSDQRGCAIEPGSIVITTSSSDHAWVREQSRRGGAICTVCSIGERGNKVAGVVDGAAGGSGGDRRDEDHEAHNESSGRLLCDLGVLLRKPEKSSGTAAMNRRARQESKFFRAVAAVSALNVVFMRRGHGPRKRSGAHALVVRGDCTPAKKTTSETVGRGLWTRDGERRRMS